VAPLKCPACETQIRPETDAPLRQVHAVDRCHVCRLELTVDPETEKLVLAPLNPLESR
jgi:hypothetical protein